MLRRLSILGLLLGSMLHAQIPTGGLAVYYPFNGTVKDESGNGRDCVVNGATFTTDRFRKPGAALYFDGTTNYVLVGKILDSIFCAPIAKFTITGWANTRALPYYQGGDAIIAKAAGGTYGPYQWAVCHDIDGKLKGFVASMSDATAYLERQSAIVLTGEWFHFALVFDGSLADTNRVQFYLNAQPGTISRTLGIMGTSTQETDQWITLGATHRATNPLNPANLYRGSIDDIRIYGRALAALEVDQLFHEGNWPAVSVEEDITPNTLSLQQNYPNPFNPTTKISFSIRKTCHVVLTIIDALGRTRAELINGEKRTGTHQVEWNASNVPSGAYFYRLQARSISGGQADEFAETRKMMLLR